jgi:NADPH-dependent glutamate synthase beta subunit-like oxidoreductase
MSSPIGTDENPLRVAIVGSGPAGFYAAGHLLASPDLAVRVEMFDRLPTPGGWSARASRPTIRTSRPSARAREDGRRAVVIGIGNVALDVARMLALTSDELAGTDTAERPFAARRAALPGFPGRDRGFRRCSGRATGAGRLCLAAHIGALGER